jgi:hypothetical protein
VGKRLQVELNEDAYERLKRSAKEEDRSIAEVVRRALNIDDYVRKQIQDGGKVLVQSPDGIDKELLIP